MQNKERKKEQKRKEKLPRFLNQRDLSIEKSHETCNSSQRPVHHCCIGRPAPNPSLADATGAGPLPKQVALRERVEGD